MFSHTESCFVAHIRDRYALGWAKNYELRSVQVMFWDLIPDRYAFEHAVLQEILRLARVMFWAIILDRTVLGRA